MKFLSGMSEIVDLYDGFIIDLWGVTHNGKEPYLGVLECLKKLKDYDKKIVFLSNAPRRAWVVKARLEEMGISKNYYDEVINSGEEAHTYLQDRTDPWYQKLGHRCYHIGALKDCSLFEGQDLEIVTNIQDADFILNSGVVNPEDTLEDFEDLLQEAAHLKLPMICANPDHIVHVRGAMEYCAGAIAHRYEELGGDVRYHGKPFPSIYDFVRLHFPKNARLLAIGDSFLTDVAGGHHARIDVAFIGGGIHHADLKISYGELPTPQLMEKLCHQYNLTPAYVLPGLIW